MTSLLTVKNGIIAALLIGFATIVYVIGAALVSSESGPLDTFAVGAMSKFRTVSDAPDQPLTTLLTGDGREISLADKRGKVVLVNFWATWCAPCVVEMPYLDTLQARYGSSDFEVIAISMDRTIEEAEDFYRERELNNLALYHDQSFGAAMVAGARGLPLTVLYDRNGGEIGRLDGDADWASDEAFALIEAVLERY
ncbi:TlpA family protein disulfide reductase [Maricaulaceae bacterium MS644]